MKVKIEIEQLLDEMTEVSDLFYKQQNAEANDKLILVLNHIEIIVNDLRNMNDNNDTLLYDEPKINSILYTAMTAIENKDYILLADLINYELKEQFEAINNCL